MAKFVVKQDTRGEWRWTFQANNYRIIAVSSEGYANRKDCQDAIVLVKQQALGAAVE